MHETKPYIALLCTLLMLAPAGVNARDNDKPGTPVRPARTTRNR